MSISAFSDFMSTNGTYSTPKVVPQVQKNKSYNTKENSGNFKSKVKKILPIALPLVAIPLTAAITYKISTKNVAALKSEINGLTKEVSQLKELAENQKNVIAENLKQHASSATKDNAQIWSVLLGIAGLGGMYKAGKMSEAEKNIVKSTISSRIDGMETKSTDALNRANAANAASANSLGKKYTKNLNGISLLNYSDSINRNTVAYERAIKTIENAAPSRLYEATDVKPITSEKPVLWSVTSEFAPIKEGGLGSVPVELQNNITALGVELPTFIPMYQQKGLASLRNEDGKYKYFYKGKEFDLQKVVSYKVDTYQDGKSKTEDVNIFVTSLGKDKNGLDKKLIFIQNDTYFNGTIYQPNEKTEEPEKFAFFSKAVYEFMKSKEDINSVKGLTVYDKDSFDSIKKPDGLVLNDWQASPIAALARYKAPMENAYKQLSQDAAKKLSEMRIITIGHNAMYQGSTRDNNDDTQRYVSTSNILNTLFDNYAYDIVSHAHTGASRTDISDTGLKNLDNVLVLNYHDPYSNHTNLLNMGVILSDYFHPVSENYAKEIISDKHPELSGELRWALNQRNNTGSLVGIINGNDFNNLSIEANAQRIKNMTGIKPHTYNKNTSIDDVMSARLENKINLYNEYMMPFSKKNDVLNRTPQVEEIRKISERLDCVDPTGKTDLPKLSNDELKKTPIISSVGRLVSQKGIKIMSDSIKILFENWDKDFPDKPKPIFYLAGQDGEGGTQRKHIEELKTTLKQEDTDRVIFGHGFAPMAAIMASSDFFMLPSIFEPCGLTQGESFAVATPVIGSAVGGIVDTVNRNGKTNGVLTDRNKPLDAQGLYEAMKQGLRIYFDNPPVYKSMVKDALAEDFSWIQKGKNGPVYDYLDRIGIKRSTLPDIG